ncbi:MAG: 3'(2'),5'-bisphosphate nucleotidase CysQ [Bacteroidetes bacterium]|nr:3'(2'),5'-bisphosphate nucleotidase CysQ [Bacteroidota bacterium]
MDIKNLLQQAVIASIKGGEEILKVYETPFDVEHKSDNSPLTIADKNAHSAICKYLSENQLPVLSEEGKNIEYAERKNWEYFWMVDPLDGTKEFIKRNGEFTVNIALIHNQRSILGVIYIPVTNVLYFAAEGIGSFKIEMTEGTPYNEIDQLIKGAQTLPISHNNRKFTVVASRSHLSEETQMFIEGLKTQHPDLEFISSGSSIKLCLVAEGSADVYPRFAPTMEWDTAAGQAICEIAGKLVIDYQTNTSLQYNKANLLNNWFTVR